MPSRPLTDLMPEWTARAHDEGLDLRVFPVTQVVFDERTVLKCRYHCPAWGCRWTCGPDTWGPAELIPLLKKYETVALVTGLDVEKVTSQALALEKSAFLAGFPFALAVAVTMCSTCERCTFPDADCRKSGELRPESPMAGIHVLETLRRQGISPDSDRGWLRASFVFLD